MTTKDQKLSQLVGGEQQGVFRKVLNASLTPTQKIIRPGSIFSHQSTKQKDSQVIELAK